MEKITWYTEKRKVSDLVEWDKNPRQLTESEAEQIRKSIEKFGIAAIPVINLDNMLVGGHQRKRIIFAMQEYGPEAEIDVRVPNRMLTPREVEELNIRLNKNTGSWDWDILANEFEIEDLLNWGFTQNELSGTEFAPDFKEYDESVEDEVETIVCPNCGHHFTK